MEQLSPQIPHPSHPFHVQSSSQREEAEAVKVKSFAYDTSTSTS